MWASTDDGNRIRLLLAVNSILALLRWHRGEPKIKKKKKGGDKREDVGGRGRKKKWKEQRKEKSLDEKKAEKARNNSKTKIVESKIES